MAKILAEQDISSSWGTEVSPRLALVGRMSDPWRLNNVLITTNVKAVAPGPELETAAIKFRREESSMS